MGVVGGKEEVFWDEGKAGRGREGSQGKQGVGVFCPLHGGFFPTLVLKLVQEGVVPLWGCLLSLTQEKGTLQWLPAVLRDPAIAVLVPQKPCLRKQYRIGLPSSDYGA